MTDGAYDILRGLCLNQNVPAASRDNFKVLGVDSSGIAIGIVVRGPSNDVFAVVECAMGMALPARYRMNLNLQPVDLARY